MSLFYGYKKDDDDGNFLPLSGGDIKGNINMGSNHIITTTDPTIDTHLTRKKYVDDKITSSRSGGGNYLPLMGGTMTGNIIMRNNKITTNVNPVSVKDLCRKKYVDD